MAKGHRSQIKRARMLIKIPDHLLSYPMQEMSVQSLLCTDVIVGKDVQTALGIPETITHVTLQA